MFNSNEVCFYQSNQDVEGFACDGSWTDGCPPGQKVQVQNSEGKTVNICIQC